ALLHDELVAEAARESGVSRPWRRGLGHFSGPQQKEILLHGPAGDARSGGETEGEVDRDGTIRTHGGDQEERTDREVGMGLRRKEDLGRRLGRREPAQGQEGDQRAPDALHPSVSHSSDTLLWASEPERVAT